jgi:hypothetical protein
MLAGGKNSTVFVQARGRTFLLVPPLAFPPSVSCLFNGAPRPSASSWFYMLMALQSVMVMTDVDAQDKVLAQDIAPPQSSTSTDTMAELTATVRQLTILSQALLRKFVVISSKTSRSRCN